MKHVLMLASLLLLGCPDANNAPAANAPTANTPTKAKESRVVLLRYHGEEDKAKEEDRLNAILKEGWRVVSTDTQANEGARGVAAGWSVTVVLER